MHAGIYGEKNPFPTSIFEKGDVNGSVEAILDALKTYKGENPKLSVVSSGVGPVTENDLRMLEPFKGKLLFSVRPVDGMPYDCI